MHDKVANRLDSLAKMSTAEMGDLWLELFDGPPPMKVRRELLIRILAYKIQEQAFGGLSTRTRRRLKQIAVSLENGNSKLNMDQGPIKPGTRLIREWRGKTHTVSVVETGFEFRGSKYGSLSEIARMITGTRWSGPLFFGLRPVLSKVQGVSNVRR
jgi:hypothetical protein